MIIADVISETYSALSSNKARSGLTILGIVIGISSVIAMVAIGQGASGSIQSNIQALGSNLIIVMPGAQRGPGFQASSGRGSSRSLTQADAQAIAQGVANVAAVSPELQGRYQVTAKGTNTNTSVIGVTDAYPNVRNVTVDEGSFISVANVTDAAKVAVIGPTVRDDLFGAGATGVVGQTIRIKGLEFRVIGVTKAKGGTGFANQDDQIFVPISSASRYFAGGTYVTGISVQAGSADAMGQVAADIATLLLSRHHITDSTQADFSTLNQADILSTASSVTRTFTLLLAAIAGISLIVGGIGIMNMMLTTVTERTKEIGLRKAIGAKRRDISVQFLSEAVMLTFVGGLIGVALGWLVSYVITSLGVLQTQMTGSSVLLAFGGSAAIGIVFGYYPARRAAMLNPIDALRYE